jgi:hypothetical protein
MERTGKPRPEIRTDERLSPEDRRLGRRAGESGLPIRQGAARRQVIAGRGMAIVRDGRDSDGGRWRPRPATPCAARRRAARAGSSARRMSVLSERPRAGARSAAA